MLLTAVVGMTGSGKTFASDFFVSHGFEKVYFGGIVIEEVKKRGLEINEANEKKVRQSLREEHGMGAMALLSIPKLEKLVFENKNIVIDDLCSWEELVILRKKFFQIKVLAVFSSPKTRQARLLHRKKRPLMQKEALERDKFEIEKMQKGGPIAVADYTIINESSKADFEIALEKTIEKIKKEN